jgi:hypothetical protein
MRLAMQTFGHINPGSKLRVSEVESLCVRGCAGLSHSDTYDSGGSA